MRHSLGLLPAVTQATLHRGITHFCIVTNLVPRLGGREMKEPGNEVVQSLNFEPAVIAQIDAFKVSFESLSSPLLNAKKLKT